ncbi:hypothetical protein MPER_02984, partial [Moniliophthora perniciosa FA553]
VDAPDIPKKLEDIAAYRNLRSEHGKIHSHEDIFMGYKHFQAKGIQPLFHFGYGLSYTKFSLSDLTIKNTSKGDSVAAEVSITVKNEGSVSGSEVVQVYISYPDNGITHPQLQLRGFAKARDLAPGSSSNVTISLDKYAVSYWDNNKHCWLVAVGEYGVHVGFSCDNIILGEKLKISEAFAWTGL